MNLGYGRRELAEAAYRQLLELPYCNSFFQVSHPPAIELARLYLPIGAVMLGRRVAQALIDKGGEFHRGFTCSGHPVACTVVGILRDERIIETVKAERAPYLQRRWAELAGHPLVGEGRGVRFIAALELVRDKTYRQSFANPGQVGTLCRDLCIKNGLVMRGRARHDDHRAAADHDACADRRAARNGPAPAR